MAVEAEAATAAAAADLALSETNIKWDRLDKTRFHVIGAVLFTAQQGLLHPTAVVKTRMQVDGGGLSHMNGFSVFKRYLNKMRFWYLCYRRLTRRVLALTALEVSKDIMMKYSEGSDTNEATQIAVANGVAGLVSTIISCTYFVPLDVICQRLMVQGLPGMTKYNGPFDVINKVLKVEGFRGLYRGFGLTILTQSPASGTLVGAYGAAQHAIWRSLGYGNGNGNEKEEKPSELELVTVQATAGTIAGACSSILTTPIDTIKTRLQVMDNYGARRPSVVKTTKLLLEEDGWRGFYRGFGPRFLNMSLWGTSMIVTYELIKRLSVKRD
ncbi:Solute carrier family 25 member 44 [Ananas comosus]|uniref:Solute carrier family 25 member 44 n=1 Tax=Ananas comosus TaxID=4615 RepID=A0A199V104_ANACO|nr:Solute carrier family 25 member 44 [Ananas comosus]